jgi:hypothetical protein
MRGGAQAHLIEAADGHAYVVKFRNNPQHRRILVNELVANSLLEHLEIATPAAALVELTPDFLAAHPETAITLGSRRELPEPGLHFGSRYPGDPARLAIYDYLPDVLLGAVANRRDFLGVLAFDKWTSNADARQAIFYRARLTGRGAGQAFVAEMMDNGFLFDGPHWRFSGAPLQGLYFRPAVYAGVTSLDDFQPWLDRIRHLPDTVLDAAWKRVPPEWLAADDDLERLLERLWRRRTRIEDLLAECRSARAAYFPGWS